MYKTVYVTSNEIIAVTNRKNIYSVITKKDFFLAKSKSLLLTFFHKLKISFLC